MLSVYSVLSGYDYTNAVVLAVFATIGAIVLQAGVLGLQTRRPIPLAAVRHRLDFPAGAPAGNHEREAGCLWRRVRSRGDTGRVLHYRPDLHREIVPRRRHLHGQRLFRVDERSRRADGTLATGLSMEYWGAPGFVLSLIATLGTYVLLVVLSKRPIMIPRQRFFI